MKESLIEPKTIQWQKTQHSNLVRYVSSDSLFARFKVRGKLVRQDIDALMLRFFRRKLAVGNDEVDDLQLVCAEFIPLCELRVGAGTKGDCCEFKRGQVIGLC